VLNISGLAEETLMRHWIKIIRESPPLSALFMCLLQFVLFAILLVGRNADPAVTRAALGVVFIGLPVLIVTVLMRAADETAAKPSDESST
jgi:hypothetical protein